MKQKTKKGPAKKSKRVRRVTKKGKPSVQQSPRKTLPRVQEELGALARSMLASLKHDDERTWKLNKRDNDEPMTSEPTWHEHHN